MPRIWPQEDVGGVQIKIYSTLLSLVHEDCSVTADGLSPRFAYKNTLLIILDMMVF